MKRLPLFAFALLLLSCLTQLGFADSMQSTLHADEHVEDGGFYTSHPTEVRVIRASSRHQAMNPGLLLRVSMERIVPNRTGVRTHHLFFSQPRVADYVEAIDQFIRMSRSASQTQRTPIARIPSWESFETRRDLVFEFIPARAVGTESNQQATPLLLIQLAFDNEHRGGSFYFTPANAETLLGMLFDFIHAID